MIQPKEHGEFCICFPPNMETGEFTYVIAVKTDTFEGMPEDLYKGEVPEATYAVFTPRPRTITIRALFKPSKEHGDLYSRNGFQPPDMSLLRTNWILNSMMSVVTPQLGL